MPAYWAQYAPKSRIYFRGTRREVVRAGFDSEEAWRQGCPLAQLGFNVAILPEVKRLDEQLAEHGGFARFNHDGGYAFGPPEVVFKLAHGISAGRPVRRARAVKPHNEHAGARV